VTWMTKAVACACVSHMLSPGLGCLKVGVYDSKVWEHANTKSSGLAGFSAKSGYFQMTLVLSRDSVKYEG